MYQFSIVGFCSMVFVFAMIEQSRSHNIIHFDLHNLPTKLNWDYDESSPRGPSHWAEKYPDCGKKEQSPIDIDTSKVVCDSTLIDFEYNGYDTVPATPFIVHNVKQWNTIALNVRDDIYISKNGLTSPYQLLFIVARYTSSNDDGSEHTINGKNFALEIRFGHANLAKYKTAYEASNHYDGLLTMAVFVEVATRPDQVLNQELGSFTEVFAKITNAGHNTTFTPTFPLSAWLPSDRTYYTYHGSMPVPPCCETMIWYIFKKPLYITQEQMENFRKIYPEHKTGKHDGTRPIQPLNERVVKSNCASQP